MAAIIIVAVIIGFAAVMNYAKETDTTRLYNLKDELGIEAEKVIDFGTINSISLSPEGDLTKHFTTIYQEFAGEDKEIYYIIGNGVSISAYKYTQEEIGTISYDFGGNSVGTPIIGRGRYNLPAQDINILSDNVNVRINEVDYEFELKEGENFYFIITQDIGGERHVVTA